ncbi:MAG: type II toxin-antitoxin system RelB/DinJ family antitoxin [Synergistaceae bacterium]|nr:type II toxin-antitoxin system RelB/DinJ family antitoxin [Synergistaceae bacterium]
MPVSTIVARVDEDDKIKFNAFCSDVGLNASTALNLFIKAVIRDNCIPFAISRTSDPFYSKANQDYVLKSVQELRAGKGTPHELIDDE